MLNGAEGCVLDIDLAFGQPFQKLIGRKIHKHEFVGVVEHGVGHRLAHPDLGDLLNYVVQAFEMLNVQCGPDIDTGGEQLVDILPALRVAAARNIGVGVFVDQEQTGTPRQRGIEVELLHELIAIRDRLARKGFKAFHQQFGFPPSVSLHQAGDHVAALGFRDSGRSQHGVGLAHARSCTQKNLQMPARLLLGEGEQGFRRGSLGGFSGHAISRARPVYG